MPPYGMAPAKRKSPGAAAALGLLWGFGAQAFYNGQAKKGIAQIIVNFFVMWGLVFRTLPPQMSWVVGLAVAAVFMYDGYKIAGRINAGEHIGPYQYF